MRAGHGLAVAVEDALGQKWPGAHRPCGADALPAQYAPGGHHVQSPTDTPPVSGLYVAAGQGTGAGVPAGQYAPARHACVATAGSTAVPEGHHMPAGHVKRGEAPNTSVLVVVLSGQYLPAGQKVHDDDAEADE